MHNKRIVLFINKLLIAGNTYIMDKESNFLTKNTYKAIAAALKGTAQAKKLPGLQTSTFADDVAKKLLQKGKELDTKAQDIELAKTILSQHKKSPEARKLLRNENQLAVAGLSALAAPPLLMSRYGLGGEEVPEVKVAMEKKAVSVNLLNKVFDGRIKRARLWGVIGGLRKVPVDELPSYVSKNARIPIKASYAIDFIKSVFGKPTSKNYQRFSDALKNQTTAAGPAARELNEQSRDILTRGFMRTVDDAGNYKLKPKGNVANAVSDIKKNYDEQFIQGKGFDNLPAYLVGKGLTNKERLARLSEYKGGLNTWIKDQEGVLSNMPDTAGMRPGMRATTTGDNYLYAPTDKGAYRVGLGKGHIPGTPTADIGSLVPAGHANARLTKPLTQQLADQVPEAEIDKVFKQFKDTGLSDNDALAKTTKHIQAGLAKPGGLALGEFNTVMGNMPKSLVTHTIPGHEEVYGLYTAGLGFTPIGRGLLGRAGGKADAATSKLNDVTTLGVSGDRLPTSDAWFKGFSDKLQGLPEADRNKILARLNHGSNTVGAALENIDPMLRAKYLSQIASASGIGSKRKVAVNIGKGLADVDTPYNIAWRIAKQKQLGNPDYLQGLNKKMTTARRQNDQWLAANEARDFDANSSIVNKILMSVPSSSKTFSDLLPRAIRPEALDSLRPAMVEKGRQLDLEAMTAPGS